MAGYASLLDDSDVQTQQGPTTNANGSRLGNAASNHDSTSFFDSLVQGTPGAGDGSGFIPSEPKSANEITAAPSSSTFTQQKQQHQTDSTSVISRDEGDVSNLGLESKGEEVEKKEEEVSEVRQTAQAMIDLPEVHHLATNVDDPGQLVENGETSHPERREILIMARNQPAPATVGGSSGDDAELNNPPPGCMTTVFRVMGKATYKAHQWVTSPWSRRGGDRAGSPRIKGGGEEDYDPGSGYERVSKVRQSEGPRPPVAPTTSLLATGANNEEEEEDVESRSTLLGGSSANSLNSRGTLAGKNRSATRSGGPMIATDRERKRAALLGAGGPPSTGGGDDPTSPTAGAGSTAVASKLRKQFESIVTRCGCPVALDLDIVGGTAAALTISGPIKLVTIAGGANPDNIFQFDEAALEAIESLFSGSSGGNNNGGGVSLTTIRLRDVDIHPAASSNFARPREWSRQTDPENEESTLEEQEDEQEWMAEREEVVRKKVISTFYTLLSRCHHSITTVSLQRSNMTPTDIITNIPFPGTGSLESLSIKDCGWSDSHLSAFVRLAQKNLNEQQKKRSSKSKRSPSNSLGSPSSAGEAGSYHTLETLLGGLKKLELMGSFSQSSMAVLLRFMRDELLAQSSGGSDSLSLKSNSPSKQQLTTGPESGIAVLGATHTPRSSQGPSYQGMRLQELLIPASLSSFVRNSEFAKRLPLLLVNGRGVSVPANRFGSMADVSSLPQQQGPAGEATPRHQP